MRVIWYCFQFKGRLFPGKLRSRWSRPFLVNKVLPFGAIEVSYPKKGTFKVNGNRLKLYYEEDLGGLEGIDCITYD
jgi:hypothetical protein